jgi:hypothetical protein
MGGARVLMMVKTKHGWMCIVERPAKAVETKARQFKPAQQVNFWREPPLRLH